jgi:hypothetical protein
MPCSIGHNDTPGQRFVTLVISRVALTFHGAEVTSTKPQMIVMLAISKRQRKTAEGDGWERMIGRLKTDNTRSQPQVVTATTKLQHSISESRPMINHRS